MQGKNILDYDGTDRMIQSPPGLFQAPYCLSALPCLRQLIGTDLCWNFVVRSFIWLSSYQFVIHKWLVRSKCGKDD